MYLVDTNIPSELTNPAPEPRVREFLIRAGKENVYASVVTIGEICKGIAALPESKKRRELRDWLDHVMRPWLLAVYYPSPKASRNAGGRSQPNNASVEDKSPWRMALSRRPLWSTA